MTRAVFVDDNEDLVDLIRITAKHAGVNVHVFSNGASALEYLNNHQTDVVILDLMMAPLDGLTIAEEIRRNEEIHLINPPVEMAFLTAADISEAIKRVAERVQVRKIFRKPVEYEQLFQEVNAWTAGKVKDAVH